jgi:hypothetical protein
VSHASLRAFFKLVCVRLVPNVSFKSYITVSGALPSSVFLWKLLTITLHVLRLLLDDPSDACGELEWLGRLGRRPRLTLLLPLLDGQRKPILPKLRMHHQHKEGRLRTGLGHPFEFRALIRNL